MKTALVTGANGFIGTRLCQELVENGIQVRALHRPSSDIRRLQNLPVELKLGDVTNPASLLEAMKGVDTVFHTAALYREARFGNEMYWKVNFEGTKNVLEAAKASSVSYLSYCSTTGVLGSIKNPPADENHSYGPLDVYQESKTEAEKLVLQWFKEGKIKGSVIRPAMVWGPHDTRLFKLFRGVANRSLPIIGDGKTLCHWILVDDLVKAFRLAALTSRSHGQLYIIGGDRPVTIQYTMEKIAECLDVKLLPFKVPAWPIQLAGTVFENLCKPFGIEPILHRRRVDFFVKHRAFDCSKAKEELGFSPTYTFENEVRFVTQWYLDNGWLSKTSDVSSSARTVSGDV